MTLSVNWYNNAHFSDQSSLFQIELMSLWLQTVVFCLLLESLLLEFDQYMAIYAFFFNFEQFQSQDDWNQVLMVELYVLLSA
jgi:hypothetical protein